MAALTRRERKVKDILLKELGRMENSGAGLTYMQKQRLEKRIDHEYIDEELAKMRKRLRQNGWVATVVYPLTVFTVLASLASLAWGHAFEFMTHVYGPLLIGSQAGVVFYQRRATRRKIFIYEALRELSDADEEGVKLDRAVHEADDLIERIVRRELGEEALPHEHGRPEQQQRAADAPFAPKQRGATPPETRNVSLTEMQRRKESGSTILDS